MLLRFLIVVFFLVFAPSLAHGQETVIIPDAPPPASTSWPLLVSIGVFYVVTGAGLARKYFPQSIGWPTPVFVVPLLSVAVATYQVGPFDAKMLLKHAGILYLTSYGGHEGGKRLLRWLFATIQAYRAGTTLPPEPPLEPAEKPSIPGPPKLPGALRIAGAAVVLCVAFAVLTGCGGALEELADDTGDGLAAGSELAHVTAECVDERKDLRLGKAAPCAPEDAECKAAAEAESTEGDAAMATIRRLFCKYAPAGVCS